MSETMKCPVCEETGCSKTSLASKSNPFPSGQRYDCRRCGIFILPDKYGQLKELSPRQRALLSHTLRRMQRDNALQPEVSDSMLPKAEDRLPSPAEQADSLILWIGDYQPFPAEPVRISLPAISAWIGVAITLHKPDCGYEWLLKQDGMTGLVERYGESLALCRLKMAGWQRYEALKRAEVESRTAFMAMQFGDEELNGVVDNHFRPAVRAAGFELRLLTDRQSAGLIDDQLRVALRTSRFIIADLTHGNNGAYWEAGFAEGLGRPVIYTCRKQQWDNGTAHFDTSHLNTIIWDPDKLEDAATRLTAALQAVLPLEAKMAD
jgi:hypothetical protein